MKAQLINQSPRTYAIIFDTNDEVMAGLSAFAEQHTLTASHFTAIGAFSELVLGYFEFKEKDYKKIPIHEQVEVLSLMAAPSALNLPAGSRMLGHAKTANFHESRGCCRGRTIGQRVTFADVPVGSDRYSARSARGR